MDEENQYNKLDKRLSTLISLCGLFLILVTADSLFLENSLLRAVFGY